MVLTRKHLLRGGRVRIGIGDTWAGRHDMEYSHTSAMPNRKIWVLSDTQAPRVSRNVVLPGEGDARAVTSLD